ncbi:hypothetical protein PR001_g10500 [Phytophthora rubi]|uniref:Uncharacterized protein n=1 Tax=Phytophthora rubi TaxID=129364 RepID=A0A6A3MNU8_9STRA|nr:hypothetical protein PR001_g10500 [Phytophthora rubi]
MLERRARRLFGIQCVNISKVAKAEFAKKNVQMFVVPKGLNALRDGGDDSGSDLEDKLPAPPAKWPKKAVPSAKTKPAIAMGATKRPSAPPRSDGGFNLHEFMTSFSPGTARE